MAYQIEFAKLVKAHLEALTAGQRLTVLDAVERQLSNEPSKETRNRKPLRPNPVAPWELRVGELRVFYEVSEGPPALVNLGGWCQGARDSSDWGPGDKTVKTIKLSTASGTLAKYAADLSNEIVLLTERNRPVAALVPLKGLDRESIVLSGHPEFLRIIARSRAEFRRGQTISLADMKAAFAVGRSPNKRLQPTKARRRSGKKSAHSVRLRG